LKLVKTIFVKYSVIFNVKVMKEEKGKWMARLWESYSPSKVMAFS
jgi:hypothetical protein